MRSTTRRRRATLLVLGLLASTVPTLLAASPANANTVATPNSCTNTAQAGTSALSISVSGSALPNPIELGSGDVTLTGGTFAIDVPATVLLAGYGLDLLTSGLTASDPSATNTIPAIVDVTLLSTGASQSSATFATLPGPDGKVVDNPITPADESADNVAGPDGFGLNVTGTTVIVDPTPLDKTSGDETASPLQVTANLPTTTWTPTGGPLSLRLGDTSTTAVVGGGAIVVKFSCKPGIPGPAGCGAAPLTACTTSTLVPAVPFTTVTVTAPPTAPVCTNEQTQVGVGQQVPINLNDNCTDVNGDIDPSTFQLSTPSSGSITPGATPGTYVYTAPALDPGAPVVLSFTVDDLDATTATSNAGTVTIGILANTCTAPVTGDPDGIPGSGDEVTGACSLTEIVVQPVVGTTMTLTKVAGLVVMSPVVLNGQAQVSAGTLQDLTVNNARGTAAPWTLSGFITDLGAPGGPTITIPTTGQTIPACSNAGSMNGVLGGGNTPNRLCIPGDNMGWKPVASIAHNVIAGDVAQVTAGPSDAADAAAWLTALVTAGAAGVDGIGGLQENNVLCSSPTDHSGGTFACDASLFLGVPASAGAGTYTGGLVLTLL